MQGRVLCRGSLRDELPVTVHMWHVDVTAYAHLESPYHMVSAASVGTYLSGNDYPAEKRTNVLKNGCVFLRQVV